MRPLLVTAVLVVLGISPAPIKAAPMDGSVPILCAFQSVVECARQGECERSSSADADLPPFLQVNVPQRMLTSMDGKRTSPIITFQRANGRLMMQGMQNNRVWGAVINEQTGQLWATIGEADGAIVLSGACLAP